MHPLFPPELVREVASYLTFDDYLASAFVNRLWNTAWTPFVWSYFFVVNEAKTRKVINSEFMRILTTRGVHIRSVFVRNESHVEVLQSLTKALPDQGSLNLASLCVSSKLQYETDVKRLVNIIERVPQLRELTVINTPVPSEWFERVLKAIAPGLKKLKKLRLTHRHVHPKVTPLALRTFLETCSEELETLVFKCGVLRSSGDIFTAPTPLPTVTIPESKAHPKLKVIQFIFGYPSNSGPIEPEFCWTLKTFLEGCTGLEVVDDRFLHFENSKLWSTDDPILSEILYRNMGIRFHKDYYKPAVHPVHYVPRLVPLATELAKLNANPNGVKEVWQTINLGSSPDEITDLDREAIVHAATQRGFQKLVINEYDWLSDANDILTILRQCTTLRVLECGYERYPALPAIEVVHQPWSCKWLKYLHITIDGIPRPDIKTDCMNQPFPPGDPLHSGTMEESRILQRRVCQQLGELVCLEELCLGYNKPSDTVTKFDETTNTTHKYNPYLQLSCLELTLEAGLDLLAGLKSLETFNVSGMDHRIGKKELFWMQREWHSIFWVHGLLPLPWHDGMRYFGSDPSVRDCNVGFRF
ncbi:hypothetical protein FBU30_004158 [Linnemannia zychae]|nr:hypothetical protein FBU30_004158 [Linnemannia zychae]